jgi:lipid-A-disaccharide synthase
MICAGEISGDMYGAAIVREIRKQATVPIEFYGFGGDNMKAEGVELYAHVSRTAVMGFWEVFKNFKFLLHLKRMIHGLLSTRRPDLVFTLDYPSFNLKLAADAKSRGIPTVHYICPQVWVWREGRIPKIADALTKLITVFPFEPDLFKETDLDAVFLGHPLADQVADTLSRPPAELPWGKGRRIAVFPGSRHSEIKRILPIQLEAGIILEKRFGSCTFMIPAPTAEAKEQIGSVLSEIDNKPQNIVLCDGHSREILRQADAGIIKSGTSTLEASMMLCPHVLIYRVNIITYLIGRLLVKGVSHIGLVNILAGKNVTEELIQYNATPENIASVIERIMTDNATREAMLEDMRKVNANVGEPGASARAASEILKTLYRARQAEPGKPGQ